MIVLPPLASPIDQCWHVLWGSAACSPGGGRGLDCRAIRLPGHLTCWSAALMGPRRSALVWGYHLCADRVRGWTYTAFVMDLCARRIVGWQVADRLRSGLSLDV